jgi:hypothetical protein
MMAQIKTVQTEAHFYYNKGNVFAPEAAIRAPTAGHAARI